MRGAQKNEGETEENRVERRKEWGGEIEENEGEKTKRMRERQKRIGKREEKNEGEREEENEGEKPKIMWERQNWMREKALWENQFMTNFKESIVKHLAKMLCGWPGGFLVVARLPEWVWAWKISLWRYSKLCVDPLFNVIQNWRNIWIGAALQAYSTQKCIVVKHQYRENIGM